MVWQKRVRALLAVLVLGLAAGVAWYVVNQRPQAAAPPEATRTDATAVTEIAADEFSRTNEAGEVVFSIKYERGYSYADGSAKLMKLTGTFARGNGQRMNITADEAAIVFKSGAGFDPQNFDDLHMKGHVRVESGPGGDRMLLETEEAHYSDLTGIMTTDKPVKVRRGNLSGSGTGATFDRDRVVVWLLADAKVTIAPSNDAGDGALDVTSGRAGLADADKYMRFEENVRMTRDGRLIQTDAAVANLTPDGKGLTSLELRGNSSVSGGAAGDGGVPNMRGDDMTITYSADTGLLERAVLMRAARLDLPEGGGKSLAADFIDLGFADDGTTVTVLDANGAVELKIPADGDEPAKEVRAPSLASRGQAPKGLDRARFRGGAELRERAPAKGDREAVDRVSSADEIALRLDGGFSKITLADFLGSARFRDGATTGEAPNARYMVPADRIILRGGDGSARVTQETGTVEAKTIDMVLDPRTMVAKENVKSTLLPSKDKDKKEPRTSILEDDQPVNVTSAELNYNGQTERAVYTGAARLWQGDTVIQAETIVLDDKTGNLEARKTVRSQFAIKDEHAKADAAPPKPTLATAEELVYDESRRQATFRENAHMNGPDGDITAARIELFLKEDGNTLDRAEAYETVTARLDGGRVATGSRLTYNAGTRRYEMAGTPLKVRRRFTDKDRAGAAVTRCEETVGSSLTFDRSADTVSVIGANGAPSRTVPIPCTADKLPLP